MSGTFDRRGFMKAAFGALVVGGCGGVGEHGGRGAGELGGGRPNVVLIYADDLGFGDTGCYGARAVKTPHIDRLAREGVRFTNGYASAATCTPSRYAMLTGEYAWRQEGKGIAPGDSPLLIEAGRRTMATVMQEAGYKTGVVGKWHLGLGTGGVDWNKEIKPGPGEIGFDYHFLIPATGDRVPCVYVEDGYVVGLDPADPITVSYEEKVGDEPTGRENPELLRMHPSHGHDMTIVNGISRIGWMTGGKSALWKDEEFAEVLSGKAVDFIEKHKEERFFLFFALHDPHVPRVPNERFVGSTEMGPRGDVITQIDWCVAQVTEALERLGLAEDTLIIFTSDNGPVLDDGYQDGAVELAGDHRPAGVLRSGKYSRYEGGSRVPFIVRWPGRVKGGQVSEAIVGQIDFAATFAALTGRRWSAADGPDSQNVLAALLGESREGREWVVEEGFGESLSLRVGDWKYVPPSREKNVAWETGIELGNLRVAQLYNLREDPGERVNVAGRWPGRVAAMDARLAGIRGVGR